MRYTTKLIPSQVGNLGILELNNPKAFHALTADMIYCFQDVLAQWKDSDLQAILLKSSPETKKPCFCSGGDVKAVYESGTSSVGQHGKGTFGLPTADFFRYEYQVDHALATFPKPQVSLWNGIVMGGGVGISIHGKYRVSTENTVFAMPETAIGLFPDVGSTFWMPRMLSNGMAAYVALTGIRLKAPDLLYTGIATHHIPSGKLLDFEEALRTACQSLESDDVIAPILTSFHDDSHVDHEDSILKTHQETIHRVFGEADSVLEVMELLQEDNTDFSKSTLKTLNKMSPTSLKLTWEGLKRGAHVKSIGEAFQMEYRMAQSCVREGSDFYEGVRALLIEKDNNPRWKPARLSDVSDTKIDQSFEPVENELILSESSETTSKL